MENRQELVFAQSINGSLCEKSLSINQREWLNQYYKELIIGGINNIRSRATIKTTLNIIKNHGLWFKNDYKKATKPDIQDYLLFLKDKGLKESTIELYFIHLKSFYIWLEMPDIVDWMPNGGEKHFIEEHNLLTPDEIKKMLLKCTTSRNKAIISCLYDSGARISELLNLKLKDVVIDDFGAKFLVNGKTGKRWIRLIDSTPYLQDWLNDHPYKNNKEAFLFINFASNHYGESLFAGSIGTLLKTMAKRAGINKYIHCHLLRHSRLNQLAKLNFNERDLRIFAGWSSKSNMPDVYLHYGEEQVEKKLLMQKGILKEEPKENIALNPKQCPRCQKINPATAYYCNCGMALDLKTVVEDTKKREEADALMNELFQDNEFKEVVKEFLTKKKQSEEGY